MKPIGDKRSEFDAPTIRRAEPNDIEACAKLYVEIGQQHFTWRADGFFRASDFRQCAAEEAVWVAVRGRSICAFLSYFEPEDFLHFLFVSECWRRQGVGSALLDHIRSRYGVPHRLKVDEPNQGARRYYARRGYTTAGAGRNDGVAWVLMQSP